MQKEFIVVFINNFMIFFNLDTLLIYYIFFLSTYLIN